MISLYKKYGAYAAVANEVGRSGSTVSKYIQMIGVAQNIQIAVKNLIEAQGENNGKQ